MQQKPQIETNFVLINHSLIPYHIQSISSTHTWQTQIDMNEINNKDNAKKQNITQDWYQRNQ